MTKLKRVKLYMGISKFLKIVNEYHLSNFLKRNNTHIHNGLLII